MHLESSLVMYRIYNAETLEKLVKTVQVIHSRQSLIEGLFTGQSMAAYEVYSQMQGAHGINIYNEFISQLRIYAKAVRILAKSYLPILLITPLKLQEFKIPLKKP